MQRVRLSSVPTLIVHSVSDFLLSMSGVAMLRVRQDAAAQRAKILTVRRKMTVLSVRAVHCISARRLLLQ